MSRKFVEDHQRRRIVVPVAEMAHEYGIADVTAGRIIAGARMSRNTFYGLFGSKSGALQFAFDEAFERLFAPVKEAGETSEPWVERLRAALDALFTGVADEPLLAELCLLHSAGAAIEAQGSDCQAGVETMMGVIHGGRETGREALDTDYRDPSPHVEEFLARGVISLAVLRISQGEAKRLPSHRDELVMLIANPFLGIKAAARAGRGLEAA